MDLRSETNPNTLFFISFYLFTTQHQDTQFTKLNAHDILLSILEVKLVQITDLLYRLKSPVCFAYDTAGQPKKHNIAHLNREMIISLLFNKMHW